MSDILFLIEGLGLRGADRVALEWAGLLAQGGHTVMLGIPGNATGVFCGEIPAGVGITSNTPPSAMVHAHSPAVTIINSSAQALADIGAVRRYSKKLILVAHSAGTWIEPFILKNAYKQFDGIIALSAHIADRLVGMGVDPRLVTAVPALVQQHDRSPSVRKEARERLGVPAAFVVGYAGRADFAKGVPDLALVLGSLVQMGSDAVLLAAGLVDQFNPTRQAQECCGVLRMFAEQYGVLDRIKELPASSDMADFWAAIDAFCMLSKTEGASLVLREAAAGGVPIVTTDCGDATRWALPAEGSCVLPVYRSVDVASCREAARLLHEISNRDPREQERYSALECARANSIIRSATAQQRQQAQLETAIFGDDQPAPWFWRQTQSKAAKALPALLNAKAPESRVDLLDTTVYVISVGSPTFTQCMAAVDSQDSKFWTGVIANVYPMDRAFAEMTRRCETEFIVQVDEDMILEQHAISTLITHLRRTPPNTYMVCHALVDTHTGIPIYGVKAYRTDLLRQIPYVPGGSASCERDQMKRAEQAGLKYELGEFLEASALGLHAHDSTAPSAFDRYYRLAQKERRFGLLGWTLATPTLFAERLLAGHGTEADLHGLLGYVVGRTAPLAQDREKDASGVCVPQAEAQALLPPKPTSLTVYVTPQCNGECRWCLRTIRGPGHEPDVTPSLLRDALSRFPSVTSVCFAGFGEPLLATHLPQLIGMVVDRGLHAGLITNGLLLEKKLHDLRIVGLRDIAVSLNAATATQRLEECGGDPEGFNLAVAGVKAAVREGFRVSISRVVENRTFVDAMAFMRLGVELGVKVNLLNLLPHGVKTEEDIEMFWLRVLVDDADTQASLAAMKQLPEASAVSVWPTLISKTFNPRRCRSPFDSIGIDGAGWLSPCRRIDPPNEWKTRLEVLDYWHHPDFTLLREQLLGAKQMRLKCRLCHGNWSC